MTEKKLSDSTRRLSSGYKINEAKDNPSGLAIAKRMNAQLRGLDNAKQNSSDGISLVQIAEGALSEIQSIVQRMGELSVRASNGTLGDEDRIAVQKEITQLCDEVERVSKDCDFNGQKIFDGSFDLKAYSDTPGVRSAYYSDETFAKNYRISDITPSYDAQGNLMAGSVTLLQDGSANAFPADAVINYDLNRVIVTASNSFEMQFDIDPSVANLTNVNLDVTGVGAMRLQIGANEGQVLEVRLPEMTLKNMNIDDIDVSTVDGALAAIEKTASANAFVSAYRARLGAYENRLESTGNSTLVTAENITAAYSRIMDVDMAEEMTVYTTNQILSEAGVSMLAQANERPQQVLQLLQ